MKQEPSVFKTPDDVGLAFIMIIACEKSFCSNIKTVIKFFKNASVMLNIKFTVYYFLKDV